MTQFHFTAWPDHGVPEVGTSLLSFHRRVKAQHLPFRGPMLVHCRYALCIFVYTHASAFFILSAGVGRTGTYIAIDNVLEQMEKEQLVDIPRVITEIRQKRMKMVQSYVSPCSIHYSLIVNKSSYYFILLIQCRSNLHSYMMLLWSPSFVEIQRLQLLIWVELSI